MQQPYQFQNQYQQQPPQQPQFPPPPPPTQQQPQQQQQQQRTRHGVITMMSSNSATDDEEEEEPLSDELSKLIGKRSSISSARKSSPATVASSASSRIPSDNDENAIIDPSFEALYEGKTGMDMFEMPEFKTKRPLKTPKEMEDKTRGGDGGSGSGSGSSSDAYIDYMAEYDDENDLHIPNRMGASTVAWGDVDQGFKAGKKLKKKEIRAGKYLAGDLQVAYDKLMEAGILLMDTSESYGLKSRTKSLSAEQILSQCMDTNTDTQPIIASAMSSPLQSLKQGTGVRFGQGGILKAIEGSAERLGSSAIDLYQVPTRMFYPGAPGLVVDALSSAMDSGSINNVGISTMSKSSMRRFNKKLSKRGGYQLTSNSFEFNLVNRKAWKSGLIAACKQEGIIPIARNPLGDGLASGVWTATNPTGGEVSKEQPFDFKTLEKYTTLHDVLANVQKTVKERLDKQNRELTDRRNRFNAPEINTDISTSQIAINYVVAKGCVPVPTIKNPKDADEIIGCLGWGLTDSEVKLLDNAADMSDKGQIV
mmetsp:Transcript_7029/g.10711  ORF Transcript_7029/g.10711 Transcript_7029/m.10711 type:complete len:536 (+) Transcript_7029:105-1712(+)